jgi:asparagine synthase (glutamine-hydrolysing)
MCGIAGCFLDVLTEPKSTIERMTAALRHRGPDQDGIYVDDVIALGARRLSVIDLAGGRQPVCNEDHAVQAVCNGEIYNHVALRKELARAGHVFATRSDTEVLVHAWEEYGERCVLHLDGMFAFAIWDARRAQLFLARDRMGEKPLYYYADGDVFVFGSELRAILEHPRVPRRLDHHSLARYLAYEYVPAPHAILHGIKKLSPGSTLTVQPGCAPHVARYWDLRFAPDTTLTDEEWTSRLRRELDDAVRARLVSDVPVGMFLSGGLDSGLIAALAARASGRPITTFSVGFAEPTYDERCHARAVAHHIGAEHEETVFGPADVESLFEGFGALLDEPLVDGSLLPLYALSRLAKRSVTVVLSGDGGDELFCGYPTFLAERAAAPFARLPAAVRSSLTRLVNRLPTSGRYGSVEFLLKQFARGLPYPRPVRTQLLLGGLTGPERDALLSPALRSACAIDAESELTDSLPTHGMAPMDELIYQHCAWYLANQNLVAVDRASMACGLEVRAPFLSNGVVHLSAAMPAELKLKGWTTTYVLKRAGRDLLPPAILHRRKQGFGVPLGPWLRGPLRATLKARLAVDRVRDVGLFDPGAVRRLVDEHVAGIRDHRKVLWSLLVFDAWREHYLPRERWS